MHDYSYLTNAPRWVVLQLTERCNLRCLMCYEWGKNGSYHQRKAAELDFDVLSRVINELSPYKPYFGLFGGEPLLYPKAESVLELLKDLGCGVDIPTNGMLLEKYAEMLIESAPRRLWISLDGPQAINDQQRGQGVYQQVVAGITKVYELRQSLGRELPKLGVTLIVTPLNYTYIERFFIDFLSRYNLDHISIEFQNYITSVEYQYYCKILQDKFDINTAPIAAGLIQERTVFASIDCEELVRQIMAVKQFCEHRSIYFIAYPKTISYANYHAFFNSHWQEMDDWKTKCAFPWIYAEVSARGDVTSCHTFYDLTLGNVYDQGILEIWRGAQYKHFRNDLRRSLFPICTGCSRYYSDPGKK